MSYKKHLLSISLFVRNNKADTWNGEEQTAIDPAAFWTASRQDLRSDFNVGFIKAFLQPSALYPTIHLLAMCGSSDASKVK